MWGHDKERGRIDGALFENIAVTGGNFPISSLAGCDSNHLAENVTFKNLRIDGKAITDLAESKISTNLFTRNIRIISSR